jgi:hypothetical protein
MMSVHATSPHFYFTTGREIAERSGMAMNGTKKDIAGPQEGGASEAEASVDG